MTLTENDRSLIAKARHCNQDYFKVWEMEKHADTDECREILHGIASTYYHNDEYSCGIL
jgi:hypothetical protein